MLESSTAELVRSSLYKLDGWLERHGWAGFDPYDLKQHLPFSFLYKSHRKPFSRMLWPLIRMAIIMETQAPGLLRAITNTEKQVNAKAMGLFARGYLQAAGQLNRPDFKVKAFECLEWLLENRSGFSNDHAWGYPFDWQSEIFIPAGTPSSVVSSIVGDGFWTAYQQTGESRYLEVCSSICQFFLHDLNMNEIDAETICFSYTPLDHFQVHNANLFVAEFLIRVGSEIEQSAWVNTGKRAANYALREQNEDGSIYYWGRAQSEYRPNHIDNYHSGFEIRKLYDIWQLTSDRRYHKAALKYYNFFVDKLLVFGNGGVRPKRTPTSVYPIDIHACAESILTTVKMLREDPRAADILPDLTRWIIDQFQMEPGWFAYQLRRGIWGGERLVKIPYIRWGQAWMFSALAELLRFPDHIRPGTAE